MAIAGARTVTDKFSLRDLVRKYTPQNGRKYILDAVHNAISSKRATERMELGEMYGYYGHGRREQHYNKTGDLRLPEFTILMMEGQPIPVNNVPSNRTLAISLDGDIVTHTQEILDTDTGRIVNGMERGNIGGWSWATDGRVSAQGAFVRLFEGFDYVTTPNFISLNRAQAMMESAGDREAAIIQQCLAQGFSDNAAVDIAQHFERMRSHAMMESVATFADNLEGDLLLLEGRLAETQNLLDAKNALLESVTVGEATRTNALSQFVDKLPVFVTSAQREALSRMQTPEDMQIVTQLFESVMSQSLPTAKRSYQPAPQAARTPSASPTGFGVPGTPPPRFG